MALLDRLPRPQSLAEAWTLLAAQAEELATLRAAHARLRTELDGLRRGDARRAAAVAAACCGGRQRG